MKQETVIKCEQCGEVLTPNKVKWLELSQTDGNYYSKIPSSHISQGLFPFGTGCATTELKATTAALQQPQDISTRKDELDITKGVWFAGEHNKSQDGIRSEGDKYYPLIATVTKKGFGVAQADNAKAICTAVNETYGKGYNPAAMEELYKALEKCQYQLQTWVESDAWSMDDEEAYEVAQTALNNAKL